MRDGLEVRKAAVIGAGVMGAAISAHLANAGIPNVLLDINSLAAATGLARAKKSSPASFFAPSVASLVSVGNLEDDLEQLRDCDWVIEAIVEDVAIKEKLYTSIVPYLQEGAILSTNTSGLSVNTLAETLPEELRKRFLVTHFFNPPRYLQLLEIVPSRYTDPAVLAAVSEFGEFRLGKGIVFGNDRPNFVANRIGAYAMFHAMQTMIDDGCTIGEVDKMTGKAIGRPKSATFRTADLVGLDTLLHVARNMHDNLPEDPERGLFEPPPFVMKMIENKWLGAKTGQGFYKKAKIDGEKTILMLDPAAMDYVAQPKVSFPSIEMAKNIEDLASRLRTLVVAKDRAGEFLWKNISATLRYAGNRVPEVADDIVAVDNALKWGFGWEMGPFAMWDAIGVAKSCERMKAEGHEIPAIAQKLLDGGRTRFYETAATGEAGGPLHKYFDLASGDYKAREEKPHLIVLADRKAAGKVIHESPDASLIDLGDEVACLEFHTKMNTIGPGVIQMMHKAMDIVEKDWRGLVIGNQAEHFSVGANLLLVLNEIDDDNFDDVDWMCSQFQNTNQRMRYSSRPVVAAPHGMTLGGGCEVVLGANRVAAAAETYIGLVELGAGVIPAGGGCKEFVRRIHETVPDNPHVDLFPLVRRVFEMVGMAKVATSAREAIELGFMDHEDEVVMNRDHVIHEAKQKVLAMDIDGYRPGLPLENMRVVGEAGYAAIQAGLYNMAAGGYITEYEKFIGGKLAYVLCGGAVSSSARVSEQHVLDLEREAFMSLVGEPKTQERMEHILKTGRPLRN